MVTKLKAFWATFKGEKDKNKLISLEGPSFVAFYKKAVFLKKIKNWVNVGVILGIKQETPEIWRDNENFREGLGDRDACKSPRWTSKLKFFQLLKY